MRIDRNEIHRRENALAAANTKPTTADHHGLDVLITEEEELIFNLKKMRGGAGKSLQVKIYLKTTTNQPTNYRL